MDRCRQKWAVRYLLDSTIGRLQSITLAVTVICTGISGHYIGYYRDVYLQEYRDIIRPDLFFFFISTSGFVISLLLMLASSWSEEGHKDLLRSPMPVISFGYLSLFWFGGAIVCIVSTLDRNAGYKVVERGYAAKIFASVVALLVAALNSALVLLAHRQRRRLRPSDLQPRIKSIDSIPHPIRVRPPVAVVAASVDSSAARRTSAAPDVDEYRFQEVLLEAPASSPRSTSPQGSPSARSAGARVQAVLPSVAVDHETVQRLTEKTLQNTVSLLPSETSRSDPISTSVRLSAGNLKMSGKVSDHYGKTAPDKCRKPPKPSTAITPRMQPRTKVEHQLPVSRLQPVDDVEQDSANLYETLPAPEEYS